MSLCCLSTMVEFFTGHGDTMSPQLRYCPFLELWQIKLALHIHIQSHKRVCLGNCIITHLVSKLQLPNGHILSRHFPNPTVFFLCCTRTSFLYTLVNPPLPWCTRKTMTIIRLLTCSGYRITDWRGRNPFSYAIFYCCLPALRAIWGNRPVRRRKGGYWNMQMVYDMALNLYDQESEMLFQCN